LSIRPGPKRAPLGWLPMLAGLALGVALALVASVLLRRPAPAPSPASQPAAIADVTWATGVRPAPTFTLTDESGAPLSLGDERGHIVLLTFMDSVCRKLCPIEGGDIAAAEQQVAGGSRSVVVLAVSVDPAADTPATARLAAAKWGWAPGTWHWLMGTPSELAAVWRSYGIAVLPVQGDIEHTGAVYVIDAAGDERAGFSVPFDPTRLTAAVRRLVSGSAN
jgi:cytochrome oxidase Cu insertion factor (SCO1/SenC/PrrC family)